MPLLLVEEAQRFLEECLQSVGVSQQHARGQALLLIHADLAGHFSHGMNRLELYIHDLTTGACDPTAEPVILKESPATAWVDGRDGLGATAADFCMRLAIRKAKEVGVGWVSAKRCNHFGMAGWWAGKAKDEGLIGMAFTNSSPVMVPTRAKESALGTNPIGMCAPATNGDSLLVDMAVTAVAMGKIEMQLRKDEPIPEGWAVGPDGEPTTDPALALDTRRLLPLGGFEHTSGYKGYALSSMVETFCSGLSGSKPTHNIRGWTLDIKDQGGPDLSQCFVAIDPDCFAPGFGERMAECLRHYRGMEPVDPSLPVLAPGDKERTNTQKTLAAGVIAYSQNQVECCDILAKRLNVKPMEIEKNDN